MLRKQNQKRAGKKNETMKERVIVILEEDIKIRQSYYFLVEAEEL
jgi:hypothetical protein